jgi:hypothetical protein
MLDESGLAWQLACFIVGLAMFSVVWFVSAWPVDMIFNSVSGVYVFGGFSGVAVNFTRLIIRLLPALGCIFLMMWLWVDVNRKGQGGYE